MGRADRRHPARRGGGGGGGRRSRPAARAASSAPPAPVKLQTPMLSMRRDPALLAQTLGNLRLGPALDAVLADPALAAIRQSSCLVVNQGATPLYSYRPTAAEIPASNLKLLTATAVFDRLGPTAHLVTQVRADHVPVAGTITGNLYLVGGGDPLLRTAAYVATLTHTETVFTNLDVPRPPGARRRCRARHRRRRRRRVPLRHPARPSRAGSRAMWLRARPDRSRRSRSTTGSPSFRPAVAAAQPAVQAAASLHRRPAQPRAWSSAARPPRRSRPAAAVAVTALASPPLADVVAEVLTPERQHRRRAVHQGAGPAWRAGADHRGRRGRHPGQTSRPTACRSPSCRWSTAPAWTAPTGRAASSLRRRLAARRAGQPARGRPARRRPVGHPAERRLAGTPAADAAAGQDRQPRRRVAALSGFVDLPAAGPAGPTQASPP